ncbi:hypothetical protein Drorol1_Dr00007928 [Drosera rotundifolia]
MRSVVDRDWERSYKEIYKLYFADNCKYPSHAFRRRFCVRRSLFQRIMTDIGAVLPFFTQRRDATDSSIPNHEMAQFFNGNNASNHIVQIGAYHHHGPFNTRNPGVAQSSTATRAYSTRGVRSSYVHRPNTARTSMGNSHLELAALQGECLPFRGDANSFRHIRVVGGDRWQFGDRGGRPRFHAERYRSLSIDLMGHDRWPSEALMIAERAAFYDLRGIC